MAQALAEAGAAVAIVSRTAAVAEAAAAAISQLTGRACRGYACDVTQPEAVQALVELVLADFGQVDILVNNAGLNVRGAIEDLTLEQFRTVQETNVTGPWLMCRALAPHFKQRQQGRVINLGSALSVNQHAGPHALLHQQGCSTATHTHTGAGMGAVQCDCQLHSTGPVPYRDEPHTRGKSGRLWFAHSQDSTWALGQPRRTWRAGSISGE